MLRNQESGTGLCHKLDTQNHADSGILRNSGITKVSSCLNTAAPLRRNRLRGITPLLSSQKVMKNGKSKQSNFLPQSRKEKKKKKKRGEKKKEITLKKTQESILTDTSHHFYFQVTKCWDFLPI